MSRKSRSEHVGEKSRACASSPQATRNAAESSTMSVRPSASPASISSPRGPTGDSDGTYRHRRYVRGWRRCACRVAWVVSINQRWHLLRIRAIPLFLISNLGSGRNVNFIRLVYLWGEFSNVLLPCGRIENRHIRCIALHRNFTCKPTGTRGEVIAKPHDNHTQQNQTRRTNTMLILHRSILLFLRVL